MPQKSQTFLRYVHNFRGLAILLIVAGHIIPFWDLSDYPIIRFLTLTVLSNGSVYFIFIAGFLFQFLSDKYKFKIYLQKKFVNVVLPYFFVSIPALCLCLLKNQTFGSTEGFASSFGTWSLLQKIAVLYLTGAHFFHFWFIPMIIIFYFFAPSIYLA